MARLELKPETEELKLAKDSGEQKVIRIRKPSFKFNCCVFLFFLFFSFLIIVLAALAETGIVDIPLFSKVFYHPPQPSRLLTISTKELENLENNLNLKIVGDLIYLEISESQLTYLVRQSFAKLPDPPLKDIQLIITNGLIEFFAESTRPFKTDVIFKVKPILKEDAQFDLELIEIRLGNLLLPPFLVNKIFTGFIKVSVDNLNESFNKIGQLKDLKLEEKKLIIISQYKKN